MISTQIATMVIIGFWFLGANIPVAIFRYSSTRVLEYHASTDYTFCGAHCDVIKDFGRERRRSTRCCLFYCNIYFGAPALSWGIVVVLKPRSLARNCQDALAGGQYPRGVRARRCKCVARVPRRRPIREGGSAHVRKLPGPRHPAHARPVANNDARKSCLLGAEGAYYVVSRPCVWREIMRFGVLAARLRRTCTKRKSVLPTLARAHVAHATGVPPLAPK
jgi:hypothetical protein